MQESTNPLLIPEILFYVAAFLTSTDLVSCTKVSRLWNNSFSPALWKKFQVSQEDGINGMALSTSTTDTTTTTTITTTITTITTATTTTAPTPTDSTTTTTTATTDGTTTTKSRKGPTLDVLCRNAPHIRSLTLRTTQGLGPFLERCTNLRTLIVIGTSEHFGCTESWPQLTRLVQRNPMMEWIVLGMNRKIGPPATFLRAVIDSCPNLRRFESSLCLYEHPEQMEALLQLFSKTYEVWTRYEVFSIPRKLVDQTILNAARFPNLVELAFKDPRGINTTRQLDIICQCPNLKLLTWAAGSGTPLPVKEFCERVPKACPQLKGLHLDASANTSRNSMVKVLDTFPDLTSLLLFGCTMTDKTFRSLRRHFHSLTSLDLIDIFGVKKSRMAQVILESCPGLEKLSLALLCMQDVVSGRDWQATRLRRLQVDLVSDNAASKMWASMNNDNRTIDVEQQKVFAQLGRLTQLRHLAIGHREDVRQPSLDFRIEHGLEALKGLTRLNHLSLEGTIQELDDKDVDWIGQHLRCLTTLKGRLAGTVTRHEELRKRFWDSHQIETPERLPKVEKIWIPTRVLDSDLVMELPESLKDIDYVMEYENSDEYYEDSTEDEENDYYDYDGAEDEEDDYYDYDGAEDEEYDYYDNDDAKGEENDYSDYDNAEDEEY
ncbi:hypothetical protein BGZ94_003863 [Podila epigama]|nr:hypothetical protein BGZ94_003863 [Podila epigama]